MYNEARVSEPNVWVSSQKKQKSKNGLLHEERTKQAMDDPVEKLKDIYNALPDHKKSEFLQLAEEFSEKAKFEPQPLPEVCLLENIYDFEQIAHRYKKFPEGRKLTIENILDHLKEQLGDCLKFFGAKEDSIFLDELRKLEPITQKMYDKLYYEHSKNPKTPHLKEIISKKSDHTLHETLALSDMELKKGARMYVKKRRLNSLENVMA